VTKLGSPRTLSSGHVTRAAPIASRPSAIFVDKFPLFLLSPFSGAPPCGHPEVTWIPASKHRPISFASRGLPGALPAAQDFPLPLYRRERSLFSKGRRAFPFPGKETSRNRRLGRDSLRYFQVRRKWERHEYVVPVTEELEFLKEARDVSMVTASKASIRHGARGRSWSVTYGWSFATQARPARILRNLPGAGTQFPSGRDHSSR